MADQVASAGVRGPGESPAAQAFHSTDILNKLVSFLDQRRDAKALITLGMVDSALRESVPKLVTILRFGRKTPTPRELARYANLKSVYFDSLTEEDLPDLTRLTALEMVFIEKCSSLKLLGNLGALQSLRVLRVRRCSQIHSLPYFRSSSPLESLTLSHANISQLPGLYGLPLSSLSLTQCPNLLELPPLDDLPLKTLTLKNCKTLRRIPDLQAVTTLTKLDLLGLPNVLSLPEELPASLQTLRIAKCEQLVLLSTLQETATGLRDIHLSNLQLPALPPLSELTNLTSLGVSQCDSIAEVPNLRGVPLTKLYISDCNLLDRLPPLDTLPLQRLRVTDCPNLLEPPLPIMPEAD